MKRYEKPYVTGALIGINILIFLLEEVSGGSTDTNTALRFGALYVPLVRDYGQWWRVFTAMWLHFGIQHIGVNMIVLFAIGRYVEAYFGRIRYLSLYLFSGLCGNLLVLATDWITGNYGVSAGASGAIFGLFSVLLIFAMTPGIKRQFPIRRVLFSILLMLLPGFSDRSISLAAHLGGLAGGFALAFLMNYFRRLRLRAERQRKITGSDQI
jgi:rhomboid protease GluP